ncbi:MAG: alpha-galactosidase [Clostridia bacterium]|nr:alpha-galactosidase [Clostridia bacterium]
MDFNIIGGSANAKICVKNEIERDGILTFEVKMTFAEPEIPEPFKLRFYVPDIDMYSVWSPAVRYNRSLGPNWHKRTTPSKLASMMPLHSLISIDGTNKMTVALSDAKTPTSIGTGICEENACVEWDITFFTVKVAPLTEYSTTVRIDTRAIPYYDSAYDVVEWWENECGYLPAYVPEHAKLPMNSLWYSYHQQLDVEDIIKECKLSKAIGMDTVIVDDGWQTDDNSRGYQFCGDWEVAKTKVPDMKEFVDRVHDTGMKIMLWFSVPFVGTGAKNYERFKDMILDDTGNTRTYFSLDPRYKEVRDFLVGIYAIAVRDWGFDGLKLDFIDSFALKGKSLEYDERRDYTSLEDAVDALMTEVTETLRAINPEVLVEFRQSYVGPAIRKYGNMLRVGDCPNDAIKNRQDVVDLRFTSGKTAVHSDMLMWHYDDTVESAALQFVATLYGVPQISVKIAKLSDEHKKMLEFYLSFWRENRDVLIDGRLTASNPESAFSIVCAEKDGKAIFTCYTDVIVDCSVYSKAIAVNSTRGKSLIIKGADKKSYSVLDCMGQTVAKGTVCGNICEIDIPLAGMIVIE